MNSVMNKTQLQKTKKKKQYELFKRKSLIRRQKGGNKQIKQNEKRQKRGNIIDEDFDLGRFFELA